MAKLKLPPETMRPKRTCFLVNFEAALQSLNDLYWGTRAGFALLQAASERGDWMPTAIPADIQARWTVPSSGVAARLAVESTLLRSSCIVYAVASYEDYVKALLDAVLRLRPLPAKKPKLEIHLSALPSNTTVEDFVRDLWTTHRAHQVLNEPYNKRTNAIEKALDLNLSATDPALPLDRDGVGAAFEVRNCIIHAGSIVDTRTVNRVGSLLPNLALGAPLPLDEPTVWRLLGALKSHAQALDLLARMKYSSLPTT
jgi:hypothetical protein